MENLLKNDYIRINFDINNNLIENIWLSLTSKMTDEEYREIAVAQAEAIELKKPNCWLVDMTGLYFTLSVDTQKWADGLFPRVLAAGVKYIAFVVSPNLFSQISVEQLMEEKNVTTANFQIKYFENNKLAKEWLVSNC